MDKVDITSPEWNDTLGRLEALTVAFVTLANISSPEVKARLMELLPTNLETQRQAGEQLQASHHWKKGLAKHGERLLQLLG